MVECELTQIIINDTLDQQFIVIKEKDGARQFPIVIAIVEVGQRFGPHRFDYVDAGGKPVIGRLVAEFQIAWANSQRDFGARRQL